MAKTIPDSHVNRLTFFTDLQAGVTSSAAALGWDAAKVTAVKTILQPLIDKYTILVDAEQAAADAGADADATFALRKPELQIVIDELRANPKCTGAMLSAMNLIPASATRDPATIKPRLTAKSESGFVRIAGSKDYAELFNIYMRRVGQIPWIQVGFQRKKFPFDDQTPLTQPGLP